MHYNFAAEWSLCALKCNPCRWSLYIHLPNIQHLIAVHHRPIAILRTFTHLVKSGPTVYVRHIRANYCRTRSLIDDLIMPSLSPQQPRQSASSRCTVSLDRLACHCMPQTAGEWMSPSLRNGAKCQPPCPDSARHRRQRCGRVRVFPTSLQQATARGATYCRDMSFSSAAKSN